jgi:tetratricopeptide (TPR) repeat protein
MREWIETLFRKGRKSNPGPVGEYFPPHSHRPLAELFDAEQPVNGEEKLAALRLSRMSAGDVADLQDHIFALEYAVRGEHLKAIEVYSRLINARHPYRLASLRFERGESYAALGRYNDAIADYEFSLRNIDIPLEDVFCRRWRLFVLFQDSRQPDRANGILRELVDFCTKVIEEPKAANKRFFFYQRALARAALRQYNEAIADCHSALETDSIDKPRNIRFKPGKTNAEIKELEAAIVAEASDRCR